MKTFDELQQWIEGAEEKYDDPSLPVCQLFLRWTDEDLLVYNGAELVAGWENECLSIVLSPGIPNPLPTRLGAPEIVDGRVWSFGLQKIAPGVWSLQPSFHVPFLLHAFLMFHGVPDPAPWERRIVLTDARGCRPCDHSLDEKRDGCCANCSERALVIA